MRRNNWGGIPSDRVVAVVATLDTGRVQVGSGYLVTDRLVLTARHCTIDKKTGRPATSLRVARRLGGPEAPAALSAVASGLDVAVIAVKDSPPAASEPPRFGRVDRSRSKELDDCQAIGFPLWQMDPQDQGRNAAELHGTIRVTEDAEAGLLVMRDPELSDVAIPGTIAAEDRADRSPWGGLSGALVFYQGLALGVVIEHRSWKGGSAMTILPVERFAAPSKGDNADIAAVAAVLGLPPAAKLPLAGEQLLAAKAKAGSADMPRGMGSPDSEPELKQVCFISSEYPPRMVGGLGAHVEQLSAALGQRIDVSIVLPSVDPHIGRYQQPPSGVQLIPLTNSLPDYDVPATWFGFANAAADKIDSLIRKGTSFDVVHCHDWVTVLAGIRCRWRHNIPLVFHLHLPNMMPLCALVENLGLACADLVTVSSNSMADDLLKRSRNLRLGLKPEQIEVINNGVDLDIFKPPEDELADDGYVLFVGRLVKQKGLEYLLRAIYYATSIPEFSKLELKIVGDGYLQPLLERLCKNYLIKNVEFESTKPWKTRPELAKLYQGASVVVVPSIEEPFGMTALEALACERPVVASDTGGLQEMITHNVNGFLAQPRDDLDLAQWLMALLSNRDLRTRLGKAGRAGLSIEYTWPQIAWRVIQLYKYVRQMPLSREIPPKAEELKDQIKVAANEIDSEIKTRELDPLFDWSHRP
jgi:glycosyltransferase involved in cell wall biosynthesis